jgi:hypothetical protein
VAAARAFVDVLCATVARVPYGIRYIGRQLADMARVCLLFPLCVCVCDELCS